MAQTYRLLVGANNRTKRVQKRKACGVVSRYFEAYTVYETRGYWRRKSEQSLTIEIIADGRNVRTIKKLARELKEALHQEAIALDIVSSKFELI